jgi:hypothetical protein
MSKDKDDSYSSPSHTPSYRTWWELTLHKTELKLGTQSVHENWLLWFQYNPNMNKENIELGRSWRVLFTQKGSIGHVGPYSRMNKSVHISIIEEHKKLKGS